MKPGPRAGFGWSRENIIYAIDLWHRQHLRPPTAREWELAGDRHPSAATTRRVYGSWNAAVQAAGFRPVGPGQRRVRREAELDRARRWSHARVLLVIRAWTTVHGRPPYADEWRSAGPGRPTTATVRRRFGSWNRAMLAAGYVPRERASTLRQNLAGREQVRRAS